MIPLYFILIGFILFVQDVMRDGSNTPAAKEARNQVRMIESISFSWCTTQVARKNTRVGTQPFHALPGMEGDFASPAGCLHGRLAQHRPAAKEVEQPQRQSQEGIRQGGDLYQGCVPEALFSSKSVYEYWNINSFSKITVHFSGSFKYLCRKFQKINIQCELSDS